MPSIGGYHPYGLTSLLTGLESNRACVGYAWPTNRSPSTPSHLSTVKAGLEIFGRTFAPEYESDSSLFGSLRDSVNRNSIGLPIKYALCRLFLTHQTGIFIAAGKSFGICYDQKFYLTDSHSCGPKGARAKNGKACVIECTTVIELVCLCKRATSSQNVLHFDICGSDKYTHHQSKSYIDQHATLTRINKKPGI
ncbi:uncharacterized protein TNCV_4031941 [Trichonephila clavipes]|nr:uncharacterized protein TNCV_4031941 [Trichonephila clavipes]